MITALSLMVVIGRDNQNWHVQINGVNVSTLTYDRRISRISKVKK